MNKILKYLKNPNLILYKLDTLNLIRINDKKYLKTFYKIRMDKELNLDNPKSFNEKLQWLKLYDKNPEYTKLVDKYEVKKIVSEKIGEEYVIPTLGVWDNFDEIDFDKLPNEFVLKCTHDSGSVVICTDKTKLDISSIKEKINECLRKNYYYSGREWPYKNVKPRIIAEKYMRDGENLDLKDYKLMCFNGKVKCSFVCSNRNSKKGLCVNFYDKEWNPLPFIRYYPKNNIEADKPLNYEKMIEFAEILAVQIPFVRVDFYEVQGKIYFGEMTFYPGGGMERFTPEEWDKRLGDMITLPNEKSGEK